MRISRISLVIVIGMACLTAGTHPASAQECPGFPDVPKDHWAYAAVTRLKCAEIVKGYADSPRPAYIPSRNAVSRSPSTEKRLRLPHRRRDSKSLWRGSR
ncbi:MAG: S-layer homology domain-containing protein [Armatimonadetes bacterium]|nr:S-layer homology domain-containing protein [Armatimonadota bacterium]